MMRILAITLGFCTFLTTLSASASWDGNFLVGVSAGYVDRVGAIGTSLGDEILFEGDLDDNGFAGGLLAGYQVHYDSWLWGAELSLSWYAEHDTRVYATDQTTVSSDYKRDEIIGLTGRIGYQISPYVMPYVRAGLESSRDKLRLVVDETVFENTDRQYRFLAGFGVEVPLPMLVGTSFRVEYNHHARASALKTGGTVLDAPLQASSKQKANSVSASLVYHFL